MTQTSLPVGGSVFVADFGAMGNVLLSGLIAALLAVFVQAYFEHRRVRREVVLDVMRWAADIFRHLAEVWMHEDLDQRGVEGLSEEELGRTRRELGALTLPVVLRLRVALLFGERSDLLQQMDAFVVNVQASLQGILDADGTPPSPYEDKALGRSLAVLRATCLRRGSALHQRFLGRWRTRAPAGT
jgi:hypothetical protein